MNKYQLWGHTIHTAANRLTIGFTAWVDDDRTKHASGITEATAIGELVMLLAADGEPAGGPEDEPDDSRVNGLADVLGGSTGDSPMIASAAARKMLRK